MNQLTGRVSSNFLLTGRNEMGENFRLFEQVIEPARSVFFHLRVMPFSVESHFWCLVLFGRCQRRYLFWTGGIAFRVMSGCFYFDLGSWVFRLLYNSIVALVIRSGFALLVCVIVGIIIIIFVVVFIFLIVSIFNVFLTFIRARTVFLGRIYWSLKSTQEYKCKITTQTKF